MDESKSERPFPGGPYILLHTPSHLLIQSVAVRCGYPASSIRERIYTDADTEHYGKAVAPPPRPNSSRGGCARNCARMDAETVRNRIPRLRTVGVYSLISSE